MEVVRGILWCVGCTMGATIDSVGGSWMVTRLLHPQHLDGVLTGLTPWGVPLDPLSECPEPWSWWVLGGERERALFFSVLKKNGVPDVGGKWWGRETESKNSWTQFFSHHFSPVSGTLFFFRTLKGAGFSLSHFLTFFGTRVLDAHWGVQAAPCAGSALSGFHPGVGDEAT